MAYTTKFDFWFQAWNEMEYRILIKQDNFKGVSRRRPLGASPVLRRDRNGRICGMSLEIQAECQVDGEFRELYTSNPHEYLVELHQVDSGEDTLVWTGFVEPELYSEPDIAPPYDVSITAVDGLGELKREPYRGLGEVTLRTMFESILAHTGQTLPIRTVSTLRLSSGGTKTTFLDDVKTDLDCHVGKTLYDLLQDLLESLNATLLGMGDHWLLLRETDVISQYGNDTVTVMEGSTRYEYECQVMGAPDRSSGYANAWPVGSLTSEIVPAMKSVKLVSYGQPLDIMANPLFRYSGASWNISSGAWSGGHVALNARNGIMSQAHTFPAPARNNLTLTLRAYAQGSASGTQSLTLVVSRQSGNNVTLLRKGTNGYEWTTQSSTTLSVDLGYAAHSLDEGHCVQVEIELPLSDTQNASLISVELRNTTACAINVHEVSLRAGNDIKADFELTANINNGARNSDEEGRSVFAHVPGSDSRLAPLFYGVLRVDSTTFTVAQLVTDRLTSAQCVHYVMAKDYALAVAAPRWKYRGTLHRGGNGFGLPLFFDKEREEICVADTFSWDLCEAEVDVELTRIPEADITVTV